MRTLTTLLAATAATALTATVSAFAQDTYVRVGGGYAISSDGEANVVGTFDDDDDFATDRFVGNFQPKLDIDGGFTGAVTAGKMFGQFGIEAEVRYDELSVGGIDTTAFNEDLTIPNRLDPEGPNRIVLAEDIPEVNVGGEDDFSSVFVMANVIAEFDDGYDDLTTYIAGGIGAGFHEVLGEEDTKLAYQFKAGVAKDFGGFEGGLEFAYLVGGEVSPDPEGLTEIGTFDEDGTFTADIIDFDVPVERTSLRIFVGTSF